MILQDLRAKAGLSQAQLAVKANITKTKISRIERGEIKIENITLATAVALAKALCVNAEDLLKTPS